MPTSIDNPMTLAFRFIQPCSHVTARRSSKWQKGTGSKAW
jgi:hypothetical protein